MNAFSVKILLAVTALFTWPLLFTQGIVGNFGDIYQYAAPYRYFAASTLQAGQLPLWNPYLFSGAPFLASPQSALFYPLTTLFCSLPMNYAFNLFTVLHIFLNALGMFLLLRETGRSRGASLAGASAWSFSFFFLSKIAAGHVIHLSGYAWTPFLILFLLRAQQSPKPTRTIAFFALMMGTTLQFFSGHVQVWLYSAILLAILWTRDAVRHWTRRRAHHLELGLAATLVFLALALVQFFPTFAYVIQSTRFRTAELLSESTAYAFATSYSMPWKNLVTLVWPDAFGSPINGTYAEPYPSIYFETGALYFGLIPLGLALGGLALCVRKKHFFPLALTLSFLILSLGKNTPIYEWIWKGLGFQRVPARFWMIAFLGLVMAATLAWDQWTHRKKTGIKAALYILMILDLLIAGRGFVWSEPMQKQLGRSAVLSRIQEDFYRDQMKASIVDPWDGSPQRICTTADIGNPNKTMFFRVKNVNGYEAILQKSLLNYFAATQPDAENSSTGIDVRHPDKNSFTLTGTRYLVAGRDASVSWPVEYRDNTIALYRNPNPLFPVQPVFTLKTFPDSAELFSYLESKSFDPRREILREDIYLKLQKWNGSTSADQAASREKTMPNKNVILLSYKRMNPNRIELDWKSQEPATFWMFLSEAYYPGWEVWTGSGVRIPPFAANGYFQGALFPKVIVPREKVYWIFRPVEFRMGAVASTAACAALAGLGCLALARTLRRKHT